MRLENAEGRAERLLRELGLDSPPIPVEKVAAHLGLQIQRASLDDVSGLLVIEADRGVIGVNAAHAQVRQRFTIAHEIGHYVLHRTELPVFIDKTLRQYSAVFRDADSSTGEDRREREANAFAAALLMPISFVRAELANLDSDVEDEETIEALAKRFKVSRQSMSIRLANTIGAAF
jgi:Zn-dependent peptidase ImmA (M78 family)